ncbi:MAG TPA: hypothetical protein VID48_05515 [Solirubrobacteraceae bacterium]|jgi:hypothetical protein
MRFLKLISVVSALTVALVVAPAGASAFKHPSPNGRCRVSINVAPRIITAGDEVLIWGRLACERPGADAATVVKLFHHLRGAPGFSYVQSTTTDSRGFYEIENADSPVDSNRVYLVRSHRAQSARKAVKVQAEVNLSGPAEGTQLYTGRANAVTFTGTVTPPDAGALISLQRQNAATGNEWHAIQRGVVQADGTFSITHAFRYPGDANIRVLVRDRPVNIPSASNVLTYEISQTQNPKLTIASSADPITFGQSVTISGTLAGQADQPVTLYARTATTHFAPLAQVNTDSEGNYSFPAQAPVNSTFYRVASTERRSAVLYEGVKDLLTASVSQTTVQAGQAVTFSGAVAPDHAGGIVYLERKNARGVGYHVIQVAIISAGSTYAIEHRFYDAGMKSVRIEVPGDPQNGATSSQPFTIEVTPVPASTLTPEVPTNSSLPAEGKLTGGEEANGEGSETEPGETEGQTPTQTASGEGNPKEGKNQPQPGRGHRRVR